MFGLGASLRNASTSRSSRVSNPYSLYSRSSVSRVKCGSPQVQERNTGFDGGERPPQDPLPPALPELNIANGAPACHDVRQSPKIDMACVPSRDATWITAGSLDQRSCTLPGSSAAVPEKGERREAPGLQRTVHSSDSSRLGLHLDKLTGCRTDSFFPGPTVGLLCHRGGRRDRVYGRDLRKRKQRKQRPRCRPSERNSSSPTLYLLRR